MKVAERCNLNCSYCYMYNHEDQSWRTKPSFMSPRVYSAALRAMLEYCRRRPGFRMALIFHGGEPLLTGHERFLEMCDEAKETLGDCLSHLSVQTNAVLVDDLWAELLAAHRVHVGVSLDGPASVHDRVRVDHAGRGSHAQVVRGIECLRGAGIDPALLCVVDPGADGVSIYRHFRELGASSINFLLPDVSHDNKERMYGTRGETPVADYLIPIFDEWFGHDDAEVKVRLFWGLLRMILGGHGETDAFGNPQMGYAVVESDGSIEPLDALKVCSEGLTQMGLNVLTHTLDDTALGLPLLHRLVNEGLPLPDACTACPEKSICGGGYYPNRYSRAAGFNNASVWCADILKLIAHVRAVVPREMMVA